MGTISSKRDLDCRLGWAWISLSLALAVHVTDEALTGFLEVYNPSATFIRERFPFLPIPTFSFEVWISGLTFAILMLLALSVFAFRGAGWMIVASHPLGLLMLLNGLLHLAGSLYFGRLMPGVYSSPLLLAAAVHLLITASRSRRSRRSYY